MFISRQNAYSKMGQRPDELSNHLSQISDIPYISSPLKVFFNLSLTINLTLHITISRSK